MRVLMVVMFALVANGFAQSTDSDNSIQCVTDARWSNSNGSVNYSRSSQSFVPLSLLVHQGKGCGLGDIHLTATFLTDAQEFICGGTIRQAMLITGEVGTFNIEIRPFTQLDFFRWRNQPGSRGIQQGLRLNCTNLDGTSEVGDPERQKAGWVRISVAVVPARGGLALAETLMRVNP
jgi:hypothetical protein